MASVFSWLAQLAGYLRKPVVSAVVAGAVATGIPTLALVIRNTRATGIVLRGFGTLFLACGLILVYVKFRVPAVKVPPTWLWIPAIGIIFFLAAWLLRMQRTRAVSNRIVSLIDATVERTDALKRKYHVPEAVDLITSDGKSIEALLKSLIRRSRRGKCVVLTGLSGSGKTSAFLNFAGVCQQMQSVRRRPIVAIYTDLVEYATKTTEELSLAEFIQNRFRGMDKAWNENGSDVLWVFLFDNAYEADLIWGHREQSWQLVNRFVRQWSKLAPLAVVADRARPKTIQSANVIELGGLNYANWSKSLKNEEVGAELARDKSFQWYLKDPGTLKLLAPALANRGWTTSSDVHFALIRTDNVHKIMGEAIARRLSSLPQSRAVNAQFLSETAMATLKSLQSRQQFYPDVPGEMRLEPIARAMNSSIAEVEHNLMALAECGLLKRVRAPNDTEYVEFYPAVAAYFYTCIMLEDPTVIPIQKLLFDQHFRLSAISLLKIADYDIIEQFIRETEEWLDQAIDGLAAELSPLDDASSPEQLSEQLNEFTSIPYAALSVVVDGLQHRLAILGDELREKTTEFIKLAMRLANPSIQNGLLEVSRILGTREQVISVMRAGLSSRDGSVVFRSSAGIVNSLSDDEVTDLDAEEQRRLVSVIIMVGLASLTSRRKRGSVPSGLRLADAAGFAAIILYGTAFGLGGVLQLINFRHFPARTSSYPYPQIIEILMAMLVAGFMALARYRMRWRQFVLRRDFHAVVTGVSGVSGFLAIAGGVWTVGTLINALATFSIPLAPIIYSYILAWPASALFYLVSDRYPTINNVIFPLPRVIDTLWRQSRD